MSQSRGPGDRVRSRHVNFTQSAPRSHSHAKNSPRRIINHVPLCIIARAFLFPLLLRFFFLPLSRRAANTEDKAIKLWSRAKRNRVRRSRRPSLFLFHCVQLLAYLLRPSARLPALDTGYILHTTYRRVALLLRNFGMRANGGKITRAALTSARAPAHASAINSLY